MIAYHDTLDYIVKELQTDPVNGLSDDKARELLEQYSENTLREKKKKTNLQRFAEQFKDVMILILIVASVISFAVAIYEGHGFFEPVLILLIVVLNATMGVLQESKAEKALEALKNLSAPQARVFRDGALAIEDICTNNSTNLTAYKQCGKLVEIERSTEKQGSITQ